MKKVVRMSEKREAVHFLVSMHELSIQRSWRCVCLSRTAFYKVSQENSDRDADIIRALNEMVEKHARWGFWKCFRVLRRIEYCWNHKRVDRIYCELHLNQKRRAKTRLPKRMRQALLVPQHPNQVWSADFMSNGLHAGNRFRTFNVIDDFNRQCLAVEIDTSITGRRLIRIFERLRSERGLPEVLRVDNGPEFRGAEFVAWAESAGMFIQYIQPGEPNQNAYIERFTRTYREEVFDLDLFRNLPRCGKQLIVDDRL